MVHRTEENHQHVLLLIVVAITILVSLLVPVNAGSRTNFDRDDAIPGGSDGKPWEWDSPNPGTSISVPIHSQHTWWDDWRNTLTPFILWWF